MLIQKLNVSLELKALGDREFEGHGAVFRNVDLGGDVILPGAFEETLKEHSRSGMLPQMFWMHQPDQVPGKWTEMYEDKKGLFVKGILADTQLGNDTRTLIKMKAVRGLSIGYRIKDRQNDVVYNDDGNRLLKKIDLWETSLVSLAMNPLAQVESAKSRLSSKGEYVPTALELAHLKRKVEQCLRDEGCSRSVAITMTARFFDEDPGAIPDGLQRDADVDQEAEAVLKLLATSSGNMLEEAFRR